MIPRSLRAQQTNTRRLIRVLARQGPTVAYRIVTTQPGNPADFMGIMEAEETLGTPVILPASCHLSQDPALAFDGLRTGESRGTLTLCPTLILQDLAVGSEAEQAAAATWLADINRQAGETDLESQDGVPQKARNWLTHIAGQLGVEDVGTERTELLVREAGAWRRAISIMNVQYSPGDDSLHASLTVAPPGPMEEPEGGYVFDDTTVVPRA